MFIIDFFKEIKKMRSKFLVYFMLCLLNLSIWHFLFIKCLGSDFILLEYFTGISYGGGGWLFCGYTFINRNMFGVFVAGQVISMDTEAAAGVVQ